ncbi:MAG: hypothetical protein IPG32_19345 [Saprospirales bacterium]|nr:hypothetical protein [Saprospirales bacterium]
MNKKLLFGLLAVLAVAVTTIWGIKHTSNATNNESLYGAEQNSVSASPIYKYDFTDSRLYATNNDTFTVPTLLHSKWMYNWTADIAMEDDTASYVLILQESNEDTGSQWYEVERDSIATHTGATAQTIRLYGSDAARSALDEGFVHGDGSAWCSTSSRDRPIRFRSMWT